MLNVIRNSKIQRLKIQKSLLLRCNSSHHSSESKNIEDDGYGHLDEGPTDTFFSRVVNHFQEKKKPGTLILVRHGETDWNHRELFTGWIDNDLSERGIREVEHAARLLLERGYTVDITYTSMLKRAIRTSWILLNEINQIYRPVIKTWRLNERMYGALEGHSKPGLAKLFGEETIQTWRAGLKGTPPEMTPQHVYWHGRERKYASLPPSLIPKTESLQDTFNRVTPLWESHILKDLRAGRNVLIIGHRTSLRGLIHKIDKIPVDHILKVPIPNGIPLVYKFDENMKPVAHKNSKAPLSGIWLEKKGLLKAALEQEEELASKVAGYSKISATKEHLKGYYKTRASSSHVQSISDSQQQLLHGHTDATSGAGAAVTAVPTNSTRPTSSSSAGEGAMLSWIDYVPEEDDHSFFSSVTAMHAPQSNLIKSLSKLETERKLVELASQQHPAGSSVASSSNSAASTQGRKHFDDASCADIFIDTEVLNHCARTEADQRQGGQSSGPQPNLFRTAQGLELDLNKLNQIHFFADAAQAAGQKESELLQSTLGVCFVRSKTAGNLLFQEESRAMDQILSQQRVSSSLRDSRDPLLQKPLLVIIRHGKTEHNQLGLFTGWEDAMLADEGRGEAINAGRVLKEHQVSFDVVYTSWLSRAIETAWLILNELDSLWLPIVKTWRLNERMYGGLTGLSKKMIKQIYGEEQFMKWRRGYDTPPPLVSPFSHAYPGNDSRYVNYVKDVPISWFETVIRSLAHRRLEIHRKFPKAESLKDCMERTIPYYKEVIVPDSITTQKNVLIASSENAIRGLLMHLCDIPHDKIPCIEIPTGLPMLYDHDRRCVRLLEDGANTENPLERYNFGSAPELIFKFQGLPPGRSVKDLGEEERRALRDQMIVHRPL